MTKKMRKATRKMGNNDKPVMAMVFEETKFSNIFKTQKRVFKSFKFKTTLEALSFATKLNSELIILRENRDVVARVVIDKSFPAPKDYSIPLTHTEVAKIYKNDSIVQIGVWVTIGYEKISIRLFEKINLITRLSKDKKFLSEYLAEALDYYKNKEHYFIGLTGTADFPVFIKDLEQLPFISCRFYIEKKEARNTIAFLIPPNIEVTKTNLVIKLRDSSYLTIEEKYSQFPIRHYTFDFNSADKIQKPFYIQENTEGETL